MGFRLFTVLIFLMALTANAQLVPAESAAQKQPENNAAAKANTQPSKKTEAPADTIVDTVYVVVDDGIPWNREHFDPRRLLRKSTLDPALSLAYTYSISFMSGPMGSISQTSYLAHVGYEFTENLHLYADVGLWMPLYSTLRTPDGFAKEDIRQGNVQFVLPDVELEYKPTENTYMRLMFINESDAMKAYGPWRSRCYLYDSCRNSRFWY